MLHHPEAPSAARRMHLFATVPGADKRGRRGASMIEYLVLVGLVALAGSAGFRMYSRQVDTGNETLGSRVRNMQGGAVAAGPAIVAPTNQGPRAATGAGVPRITPLTQGLGGTLGASDPNAPQAGAAPKNYDAVEWKSFPGEVFVRNEGEPSAVSPNDVAQGRIQDCYVIAAMMAVAGTDPQTIERLIQTRDGIHHVTLYDRSGKREFKFDDKFPVAASGKPLYAQTDPRGTGAELWGALLERAIAEKAGGYDKIGHGGSAASAMVALTGRASKVELPADQTLAGLAEQLARREAIVVGTSKSETLPLFKNDTLITNHAYWLEKVDVANNQITLHNPFGWKYSPPSKYPAVVISFEDYQKHFNLSMSNSVKKRPAPPPKSPTSN